MIDPIRLATDDNYRTTILPATLQNENRVRSFARGVQFNIAKSFGSKEGFETTIGTSLVAGLVAVAAEPVFDGAADIVGSFRRAVRR